MEAIAPQNRMKDTLAKAGIPFKEIEVYGSQIVITSWSRKSAEKWGLLLAKFARVRGIIESRDYDKVNQNTVLRPSSHAVWRTFARVEA